MLKKKFKQNNGENNTLFLWFEVIKKSFSFQFMQKHKGGCERKIEKSNQQIYKATV